MTSTSLTTAGKTSWYYLPAELRILVLEALLQDSCSFADFATVSREWQTIVEPHNFARITLTPSRLADFGSMTSRNRGLVRYIWLCLELREYDCAKCAPEDIDIMWISNADKTPIIAAFLDLFSTLSAWEPNGNLLLDISVHPPGDSKHWFKYLAPGPDIPSDECHRGGCAQQFMPVELDDYRHGWVAGKLVSAPYCTAIHKVFDEIMGETPLDDNEQENGWWKQLPLVPVVTGVLLRQHSRRRWKPTALAQLFARLPRLQEIHYESRREWYDALQMETDQSFRSLFGLLASSQLRRLVLFENVNQQYPPSFRDCEFIRIPSSDVSREVAKASLKLERFSGSFIVDASYFFHSREPSWMWPSLTSLALTSEALAPDKSPIEIDDLLRTAAATAMKMPSLEIMEIWNGQTGLATLFRYQRAGERQSAVITWRGTWKFALGPRVVQAWEEVALKHRGHRSVVIVKELLEAGAVVQSHAHAIHYLKLLNPVIRPDWLQQIRAEHRIREAVHDRSPISVIE